MEKVKEIIYEQNGNINNQIENLKKRNFGAESIITEIRRITLRIQRQI